MIYILYYSKKVIHYLQILYYRGIRRSFISFERYNYQFNYLIYYSIYSNWQNQLFLSWIIQNYSLSYTIPPKQKVYVPYPTQQSQQDYFNLYDLRIQKCFDCDQAEHFKMDKTEADYLKRVKVYPCYSMFYEAAYACINDIFDFLKELAYIQEDQIEHLNIIISNIKCLVQLFMINPKMQKEQKKHIEIYLQIENYINLQIYNILIQFIILQHLFYLISFIPIFYFHSHLIQHQLFLYLIFYS